MNDMVERVARAMSSAENMPYLGRWDLFVPAARAALAAMRTPTEAMIHCSPVTADNFVPYPATCAVTWTAMIDAALGEGE